MLVSTTEVAAEAVEAAAAAADVAVESMTLYLVAKQVRGIVLASVIDDRFAKKLKVKLFSFQGSFLDVPKQAGVVRS